MLKSKPRAEVKSKKEKVKNKTRIFIFAFCLLPFAFATACRYDMQDQPRYKAFKQSDFFADKRASRDLPNGTIPRGQLRADKALYTGKKENADPNAPVQTVKDEAGNTLIAS